MLNEMVTARYDTITKNVYTMMSKDTAVRVSVIIPVWNRADTVVNAVRDAICQTEGDLEVLVCDDGSTDDSRARVGAIGDPRVRWLDGPRSGCPAAPRNRGLREARG